MTDKTSGAAFPIPATELHGTNTGMTLRDYLAAKAMNAIMSDPEVWLNDEALENHAVTSYRMADAMLKARG